MRIGIPRETLKGENRVAATPKTVPQLIKLGYEVSVEKDAGVAVITINRPEAFNAPQAP